MKGIWNPSYKPVVGRWLRWTASVVFLLAGLHAVHSRDVRIDGISLYFDEIPVYSVFKVYFLRGVGYHESYSATGYAPRSDVPTGVVFSFGRLTDDTRNVRIDVRPGEYRLASMVFETRLPGWRMPLASFSADEVAAGARPLHDITSLVLRDGRLHIVGEGPFPYFDTGISYREIRDRVPAWRVRLAKFIWSLWIVAGTVLILYIHRVARLARVAVAGFVSLLAARSADALRRPPGYFRRHGWWMVAAVVFFLAALAIRSWDNLTHPGLYYEDAAQYFNVYYGGEEPFSRVLIRPAGYLNLANNVYAWVVSHFDVRLQPTLYLIFAITLSSFTAAVLMGSGLFTNNWILLVVPTVIGLSGFNDIFYIVTLNYQMYVVVILLLSLLLYPAPNTNRGWWSMAAVMSLLVWSGPFSVVVVPISAMLIVMFGERRKNLLLCWVIGAALIYYATVRGGTTAWENLLLPGIGQHFVELLVGKIMLFDLFGRGTPIKALLLAVAIVAVFTVLHHDRIYLKTALTLLAGMVGALAPYFLSIKYKPFAALSAYQLVSWFLWLVFVLLTADRLLQRYRSKAAAGAAVAVAFLVLVYVDNHRHPNKAAVPLMNGVPRFLETIRYFEQQRLAERNEYVIIRTEGNYPGFLEPEVRVGSRQPDAKRLGAGDVSPPVGRDLIVDPGI